MIPILAVLIRWIDNYPIKSNTAPLAVLPEKVTALDMQTQVFAIALIDVSDHLRITINSKYRAVTIKERFNESSITATRLKHNAVVFDVGPLDQTLRQAARREPLRKLFVTLGCPAQHRQLN